MGCCYCYEVRFWKLIDVNKSCNIVCRFSAWTQREVSFLNCQLHGLFMREKEINLDDGYIGLCLIGICHLAVKVGKKKYGFLS